MRDKLPSNLERMQTIATQLKFLFNWHAAKKVLLKYDTKKSQITKCIINVDLTFLWIVWYWATTVHTTHAQVCT